MKKVFYTLLLIMTSGHLFAQTWDGSSSTAWNTPANWSTNAVPASGSAVIINAAVANQPKLSANVTIASLSISNGSLDLMGYTLTVSGTSSFTGGTVLNGTVVTNNSITQMQNTTFTGPLTISKTTNSGGAMTFNGGNTFNGAVTINHNANMDMTMANVNPDVFNGDMSFIQGNGSGNLYPASKGLNNFKGNISTVGTVKQIVFGQGGGSVVINGNKIQTILGAAGQCPRFNILVMNTTGNITLQTPLVIGTSLTMTNGLLFSTATNLITLNNNVTASGMSNASYVYGPVRKIGNQAFIFPTGRAGVYAPISISAPILATDHFTAEYFNIPTPHNLTLLSVGLHHVSKEEYWSLNRTNGVSPVYVTLHYSAADRSGGISNLGALRVSGWNGLLNLDLLNGGNTGDFSTGTVRTLLPAVLYGDFTLASATSANTMTLTFAPGNLSFKNPTTSDNITWKFSNVRPGVDAMITVLSTRNANLDKIDDSSNFKNSWQPFITYPAATTNPADSSFVEFRVTFVRNGVTEALDGLAMTIVDEDGDGVGGTYRELVKISNPATPKGINGSGITTANDAKWLTLIGAEPNIPSIDTVNVVAMAQVNMTNVSSYVMKVGVVGRIDAGETRQSSFAFKSFNALNVVLPVKLLEIGAQYVGKDAKVSWATSEEENMNSYAVYRSVDGINFTQVGEVEAKGFSQVTNKYSFVDMNAALETSENTFYKLKMTNNDGKFTWSPVVVLTKSSKVTATLTTVYPNPTKGELSLNFENSDSEFTVEVVDMFGKVLQSYTNADLNFNSTLNLDVTEFSTGIYFIKVSGTDGNSSLTKFIKN